VARRANNLRIEVAWRAHMGSRNRHSVETDQGHAIFLGSRFNRESLIVNAAAFASGCGVFFLRT
jgi:hypothetical protein